VAAKPNFFIVGAPKCGTTALYEYLRRHPRIFMPKLKEPHFFATDLGGYPVVETEQEYAALFAEAGREHLKVGEASVYYLRSGVAASGIRAFDPGAKIIAMVRNPVDMAQSLHAQLLYVSDETVSDFEAAWRLQERRRQSLDVPTACRAPSLLQYEQLCRLGTQIQRLLSIFPPAQVKLIVFDDFIASPRRIYNEVIEFLDVPHDHRSEFPRINDNKRARIAWLKQFMRRPPPLLRTAFRGLKHAAGAERLATLKSEIVKLNTLKEGRPPLSPAFRAELVEAFREEVFLLSRLLNRDLSQWAGSTVRRPAPLAPRIASMA
jgi:hypothetical protein